MLHGTEHGEIPFVIFVPIAFIIMRLDIIYTKKGIYVQEFYRAINWTKGISKHC